jgi:hypothetical protein
MGSETLGCFQFLDRAVNLFWVEANLKCEEIGGYLAEPRTARYKTHTTGHPLGFVRFIIYVYVLPTKIKAIYYRQAEFLHQLAAVYEATTGIAHWWIGLTDIGR